MKKFVLPVLFIALMACTKTNAPAPTTTSSSSTPTVVVDQQIGNSYTFAGTTYTTTIGGEETLTPSGGSFIYALVVEDASEDGIQFWFSAKPSVGTYPVTAFSTTVPYGTAAVYVNANGVSFGSVGQGSITISIVSGYYVVSINNVPLQNITTSSAPMQTLSAAVTVP